MCYDISFKTQLEEMRQYFPEVVADPQLNVEWPEYEHLQGQAFPKLPILFYDKEEGKLRLRVMEWGIIRHYEKEDPVAKDRNFNLNIMSEKIFDPKSYWYKIRYNICLIPLTGTFEHRGIVGWGKKLPYYIRPKDSQLFFLPGLYTKVTLPDKKTGELKERWTFGLETREPSPDNVMRQIHNDSQRGFRMALYLPFKLAKELITPGLTDERYKQILAYEMKSEDLYYHPTDTIRTAKPRKDGKKKYEAYDWEGKVPPLGTLNPLKEI